MNYLEKWITSREYQESSKIEAISRIQRWAESVSVLKKDVAPEETEFVARILNDFISRRSDFILDCRHTKVRGPKEDIIESLTIWALARKYSINKASFLYFGDYDRRSTVRKHLGKVANKLQMSKEDLLNDNVKTCDFFNGVIPSEYKPVNIEIAMEELVRAFHERGEQ
ncbi:hypothetical protein N9L48_01860 [Psychrosphaera sp.]|nr:hypothetical protein [Psychrosphaera sp.]